MPRIIRDFSGEYAYLNNTYFSPIVVRQAIFPGEYRKAAFATVMHAYLAEKVASFANAEIIRMIEEPSRAYITSQDMKRRGDWCEGLKLSLMTRLIDVKFPLIVELYRDQGYMPKLTSRLLATDGAILLHENNRGDMFWGSCNGVGENHLGKIIMLRRSRVQSIVNRLEENRTNAEAHRNLLADHSGASQVS